MRHDQGTIIESDGHFVIVTDEISQEGEMFVMGVVIRSDEFVLGTTLICDYKAWQPTKDSVRLQNILKTSL